MRKFLIKALFFLIPIVLITAFFEIGLSRVVNSYNTKKDQLEAQKDSIQLLILGNSQSLRGVNPYYFTGVKAYNVANVAQSIFYDSRILLKYIDSMPKLKCVMIGASYVAMGYQIRLAKESWRDYYYEQFWGITYPTLRWYDLKRYSKILLYTPDTTLAYACKGFKVNLAEGYKWNGWAYVDTNSINRNFTDAHVKATAMSINNTYTRGSVLKSNYNDIINLIITLKKRHITPIVFTPPTYSGFTRYAYEKPKYVDSLSDICKRYNCAFYNYFEDSRFSRKDYFDFLHLNYLGAEKFSKILNDEVVKKEFESKL